MTGWFVVVIVAEVGTLAFFLIYAAALHGAIREDRKTGRVAALDTTGRALISAAKYGFIVGLSALTLSSLMGSLS